MGGPVPGSLRMRPDKASGPVGTVRNLQKTITVVNEAAETALDFVQGGREVLDILDDIYGSDDVASEAESNKTDLIGERFPAGRERDLRGRQPTYGGGLKNISLKLGKPKLLPDFRTMSLFGEAKATLEIPTPYPPGFDSPTEIDFKITSTSISPSEVGFAGTATAYKVLQSKFKLQFHYSNRQLIETIVRFAKARKLKRAEVEQLLRSIGFDASATVKLGLLPVSYIKVSAPSVLPMRRPLVGATEEALPAQVASIPGREVLTLLGQIVPKGVFFDVPVPGVGAHYSKFGTKNGVSATAAGLAKPDMEHLGRVQLFGYVDLHYARRVSETVDVNVGITYTYSPSGAVGEDEKLQVNYLHARGKPWMPETRDNEPDGKDRSGHNFMFSIKGTFDALGGR